MSDANTSDPTDPAPGGPSAPLMHAAAFPMAHHVASTPPMACDCEAETRRIMSDLTQQHATSSHAPVASPGGLTTASASASASASTTRQSSSAVLSSPSSSLAGTLKTAHALVQHWGNVNGCPNAEAHMDAAMLSSMTDAIRIVLHDHEIVVESISSRGRRHHQGSSDSNTPTSAAALPKALIGELELEPLEQAIVVQESVKHSIVRLAAVLQDIEEEVTLAASAQPELSLRDRSAKELITRLFRLLGTVNQIIVPAGNLG
ncbi:hypothetical protein F4777DRAFT_576841 [Nemania sp. FL0916]|nr:hypothetical protein F4777DRAFT_576841 [Nemania sp. FL0916]